MIAAAVQRHHDPMLPPADAIHRHSSERGSHQPVNKIRIPAAKIVSQIAHDGLLAGRLLDLNAQVLADAHFFSMTESVGISIFPYLVTFPLTPSERITGAELLGLLRLSVISSSIRCCRSTLCSGMQQRIDVT